MAVISYVQPPVTLQVQKRSFDFPWDMEIRGPYLLPGRSPVPEPVYLDAILLQSLFSKIPVQFPLKMLQNTPVLSETITPALS